MDGPGPRNMVHNKRAHIYPKLLVIQVLPSSPRENNFTPEATLIIGNGQKFRSDIQSVLMNYYSILIPTLRAEWLLKTHMGVQTHMHRASPQRNYGADILYIYQETLDSSITVIQNHKPFPPPTFIPQWLLKQS